MFKSNKNSRWFRSFILCFAVGTLAITGTSPAVAQHERSCHLVVEVNPTGTGLEGLIYSFRVFINVSRRSQANDGRREVRQHVTDCVLAHWNDRNETRPYACQDWGRANMEQYPFNNMYEQIRQDICDKNRNELRLPVNIEMFIRGKRGCLEYSEERGVVDPAARVEIASNFTFNCPIREGGRFECVGECCEPPLPHIRLPGNDLPGGVIPTPDEGWCDCQARCERNTDCQAWTWRDAGTSGPGSPEYCLLKSQAGQRIQDDCCHSGIKE